MFEIDWNSGFTAARPADTGFESGRGRTYGLSRPRDRHIRRWSGATVTSQGEGCARVAEPEDSTREEEGEGAL